MGARLGDTLDIVDVFVKLDRGRHNFVAPQLVKHVGFGAVCLGVYYTVSFRRATFCGATETLAEKVPVCESKRA